MDSYEVNRVYYAPQNLMQEEEKITAMTNDEKRKLFTVFIKAFQEGNVFVYREQLKSNLMKKQYFLEFNFDDINGFNQNLGDQLLTRPSNTIPQVI